MNDDAEGKPKLKVLHPVNDKFNSAFDYLTYHSEEKSQGYDDNVTKKIPKWSKRLAIKMKSKTFHAKEPIPTLSFLDDFELACDSNGVPVCAAMWCFHLLMRKPTTAVLNASSCLKPEK